MDEERLAQLKQTAIEAAREVDTIDADMPEEEKRRRRHNAAVRGLSGGALLGYHASPALVADVQAWTRGEINTEEMATRLITRAAAGYYNKEEETGQ